MVGSLELVLGKHIQSWVEAGLGTLVSGSSSYLLEQLGLELEAELVDGKN